MARKARAMPAAGEAAGARDGGSARLRLQSVSTPRRHLEVRQLCRRPAGPGALRVQGAPQVVRCTYVQGAVSCDIGRTSYTRGDGITIRLDMRRRQRWLLKLSVWLSRAPFEGLHADRLVLHMTGIYAAWRQDTGGQLLSMRSGA